MIIIYHNPMCINAKRCVKILDTKFEQEFDVKRQGLDLSEDKLKEILRLLNCRPKDLLRKNESIWKTLFKFLDFTDDELIKIMLKYPLLIKGPIVINGNKAVIGRPPEQILNIVERKNLAF